ncbi:MAG: PEP-CTERM sorting domain-containing protein [Gemmatimonadota bacterium]
MRSIRFFPLLGLAVVAACSSTYAPTNGGGSPAVISATFLSAGDSASIAPDVDAFRAELGGFLHPPAAPADDSGRREVNWDGVPPAQTNVNTFPGDFFNVTSTRGLLMVAPGNGGFRVDSSGFGDIDSTFATQFKPFSPRKLFMPVGTAKVELRFDRVHTSTPGLIKGFGVVFSDVDRAGSTKVECFDSAGVRIASLQAVAASGSGLYSFVGVVFTSPVIASVQITSGESPVNGVTRDLSVGGTRDLVTMDDFIYGEPQLMP